MTFIGHLYGVIYSFSRGDGSAILNDMESLGLFVLKWCPQLRPIAVGNLKIRYNTYAFTDSSNKLHSLNKYEKLPHDDVIIKSKHFPRYWPFVWEFTGEFPSQKPVARSFGVFFDLRLESTVE